jgi:GNAT superfamily N-acetyltransferase
MVQRSTGITDIPRSREAEAVDILLRAFQHDPAVRFFFQNAPDYSTHVRERFHFLCEVQFELEYPLLGCFYEGQLVGVACFAEPISVSWPASLIELWDSFSASVGRKATERLEKHGQLIDRLRPNHSHYYLGTVGVDPEVQGWGYGRRLPDATQQFSQCHPESTGAALETENPLNVPLYDHLGYRVVTKTKLDELDVWVMFRPNEGR